MTLNIVLELTSLTGGLSTIQVILGIFSSIVAIVVALLFDAPQRTKAIFRPITITSPVFEVSNFIMFTEQEFSIDTEKQLKGVPIFVQNRGNKSCVIEALWIEPCTRTSRLFPETIPRIPLTLGYVESRTVSPAGGQVEIRAIPDSLRYLEQICKESRTDACRICVKALPYKNARSRKFSYRNWQMYHLQVLWGATRKNASVLIRQAAQEKKSDKEAVFSLWKLYYIFMPEPVTSLSYAKITLDEEAAKGNIPQAYLEYASKLTEEQLKPLKDAIDKAIAEGKFPFL